MTASGLEWDGAVAAARAWLHRRPGHDDTETSLARALLRFAAGEFEVEAQRDKAMRRYLNLRAIARSEAAQDGSRDEPPR